MTGPFRPTPTQLRVLEGLCEGRTNKEIARALGMAPETVRAHLNACFDKSGVRNRTQLAVLAVSTGLVDVGSTEV